MTQFLAAVVPSAGVLFLFWLGIKAVVEADRRERSAQARIAAVTSRNAAPGDAAAPVPDTPGDSD